MWGEIGGRSLYRRSITRCGRDFNGEQGTVASCESTRPGDAALPAAGSASLGSLPRLMRNHTLIAFAGRAQFQAVPGRIVGCCRSPVRVSAPISFRSCRSLAAVAHEVPVAAMLFSVPRPHVNPCGHANEVCSIRLVGRTF